MRLIELVTQTMSFAIQAVKGAFQLFGDFLGISEWSIIALVRGLLFAVIRNALWR